MVPCAHGRYDEACMSTKDDNEIGCHAALHLANKPCRCARRLSGLVQVLDTMNFQQGLDLGFRY